MKEKSNLVVLGVIGLLLCSLIVAASVDAEKILRRYVVLEGECELASAITGLSQEYKTDGTEFCTVIIDDEVQDSPDKKGPVETPPLKLTEFRGCLMPPMPPEYDKLKVESDGDAVIELSDALLGFSQDYVTQGAAQCTELEFKIVDWVKGHNAFKHKIVITPFDPSRIPKGAVLETEERR
jgi:hypothetical protein